MGISVQQWRARIGKFIPRVGIGSTCGDRRTSRGTFIAALLIGSVLASLLIIGGVEQNPGPTTIDVVLRTLSDMRPENSES